MKEKFAQNMEVPVSLMEFLLQTQGSFGGFFLLEVLNFTMFFRGIGLSKLFFLFLADKIRNSNVFQRMCFHECVSVNVRECVSANVFLICF